VQPEDHATTWSGWYESKQIAQRFGTLHNSGEGSGLEASSGGEGGGLEEEASGGEGSGLEEASGGEGSGLENASTGVELQQVLVIAFDNFKNPDSMSWIQPASSPSS
jgi:hypothetical protein